MKIDSMITKLRNNANMSQQQLADLMNVSKQSVQKWERGLTYPEFEKLIKLSKLFGVSLDMLVFDGGNRMTEVLTENKEIKPQYANMNYSYFTYDQISVEYQQSVEEGLDIERYKDLFSVVATLPHDEIKKKLGDVMFEIVRRAKQRNGYKYNEPSDLEGIKALRNGFKTDLTPATGDALEEKIHGAWLGRICGCFLGKPIEGIMTEEFVPFLKETGNYPMHRYILWSDITEEIKIKYKYNLNNDSYADKVNFFPGDDDIAFTLLAQAVISKYGRDFTPQNVADMWLDKFSRNDIWSAEKIAYTNLINGFEPPESAVYKNPFREWVGAQIRGDYYGYINPGNPELAAEMAFRDASISHTKNGIYGEMFVAAMLAIAACTNDIKSIIRGGLAQMPTTSRLYEEINHVMDGYCNGVSKEECFADIHARYDEHTYHASAHTIPNAMIVVAALLYGGGDYGKSICMAVETGFDTDCNGATVGSVVGMVNGKSGIGEEWTRAINDRMRAFGRDDTKISDRVEQTLEHIEKLKTNR